MEHDSRRNTLHPTQQHLNVSPPNWDWTWTLRMWSTRLPPPPSSPDASFPQPSHWHVEESDAVVGREAEDEDSDDDVTLVWRDGGKRS